MILSSITVFVFGIFHYVSNTILYHFVHEYINGRGHACRDIGKNCGCVMREDHLLCAKAMILCWEC